MKKNRLNWRAGVAMALLLSLLVPGALAEETGVLRIPDTDMMFRPPAGWEIIAMEAGQDAITAHVVEAVKGLSVMYVLRAVRDPIYADTDITSMPGEAIRALVAHVASGQEPPDWRMDAAFADGRGMIRLEEGRSESLIVVSGGWMVSLQMMPYGDRLDWLEATVLQLDMMTGLMD